MAPRVALIDYGSGNIRSVEKALQYVGANVERCENATRLSTCDAVVLPGVGSFGDCARSLCARGLTEPLREWLANDRPYLGICLGYQILFEGSEEDVGESGLGHWRGYVKRFPTSLDLKVPHIGWNDLQWKTSDAVFAGLPDPTYVFFVHSYFPVPAKETLITATATYGVEFAAAAGKGRIRGMQFHPEKSQSHGLHILKNFVNELKGNY